MGNTSSRDVLDTYWTVQCLIFFAATIAGGFLLIKIIRDQKITIEYLRFDENRIATELGQCKQLRLVYS